jgi:hypothetical protein
LHQRHRRGLRVRHYVVVVEPLAEVERWGNVIKAADIKLQ